MTANADWRLETQLVQGGLDRSHHGETAEALFLTSGFVYERAEHAEDRFRDLAPGFMYSRYGNPTVSTFEARLAAIEGAEACCAVGSGMAAVNAALMCRLKAGDRVVAARALFGSCRHIIANILPRFGIEHSFVDGADLDQWRQALSRPAALVFFETPSNPTLELVDIAAVAELAHAAGAEVVVDNVFATPLLQRPLALGADVVVYSATKHIDGQGRCLGGAVLGTQRYRDDTLHPYLKHTGPSLSPFNAWVLLKGLETLPLRVARQCQSARRIAEHLEAHPKVRRTLYPGLASHPQHDLARRQMQAGSTLIAFHVGSGENGDSSDKERAFAVLNRLRLAVISNNLGDSKTMVTHPATTTHSKLPPEERRALGITDDLIRLSVGLEHVDDLIADLDQALA
ncbi:MAG: O-succinylhomoserine sulfhydrylase [Geminicoccaceae bacterium]